MRTFLFLLLLMPAAFAHGNESFARAEAIISNQTPCSQLTDSQLEMLGDYYMEQMHPGKQHELMDRMMGGEGSASLRSMHIQMARSIYCGESSNYGMMGGGMMGPYMIGYGTGYGMISYLYIALLVGLVILIYLAIARMVRGDGIGKEK